MAGKLNGVISWTVPGTGFQVLQQYWQIEEKQLNIVIGDGIRWQPKLEVPKNAVDKKKQRASITPNLVHSLDAAALVLTVVMSNYTHRLTAFSTVHDSYATVPGDMIHVMGHLRGQFVGLYQGDDVVRHINEQLSSQFNGVKGELPAPPAMGDLDIEEVRKSLYFFL